MRGVCVVERIQIENVRSLKNTGSISLSPLTLLVGTNSSGKSTFLRIFPLIKQSICKRTDGPLLWAGDVDDYVDFGSFSETVTNDGLSDRIRFSFSFSIRPNDYVRTSGSRRRKNVKALITEDIHYSIEIAQKDGREYVSKLDVFLCNERFVFDFPPQLGYSSSLVDPILVNDIPIIIPKQRTVRQSGSSYSSYGVGYSQDSIFGFCLPSLHDCISDFSERIRNEKADWSEIEQSDYQGYSSRHLAAAMAYIGMRLCHNERLESIQEYYKKQSKKSTKMDSFDLAIMDVLNHLSMSEEKDREKALALFRLLYFYEQFSAIDGFLNVYFRQVHYIAPLRATAERYYRLRNLAIDEVDFQGKNLAIFLNGLSQESLFGFQQWTERFFGFKVVTERGSGHLSVKIALEDSQEVNLSDTGFGYSQILPIITQLWDLSSRKANLYSSYNDIFWSSSRDVDIPLVIAIEQPELHLHPALQARLAKAFIASIRLAQDNGYRLQLLIETHSETIVNYFGRAIQRKELGENEISLVVFDKPPASKETLVRVSNYDQDGYLRHDTWPIGFFSVED